MSADARWEQWGDAVDDLVTLNLRAGGRFSHVGALFRLARDRSGSPLAAGAAKALQGVLAARESVLLVTGFVSPPVYAAGETDGPVGAAVLGIVLRRVFGSDVFFLCEREVGSPLSACCRSLARPDEDGWWQVRDFPRGAKATLEDGRALLDELSPGAVIAVEKAGLCSDGTYRSLGGIDLSPHVIGVDPLFRAARDSGVLTVSALDAPNEVGIGSLPRGEAGAILPSSPLATTETDLLVVGTVANWAAYSIAACVALAAGRRDAMVTADETSRALEEVMAAGALDAGRGFAITGGVVDGFVAATDRAVIALLHEMLAHANRSESRDGTG